VSLAPWYDANVPVPVAATRPATETVFVPPESVMPPLRPPSRSKAYVSSPAPPCRLPTPSKVICGPPVGV
jgi:hypothetical protein